MREDQKAIDKELEGRLDKYKEAAESKGAQNVVLLDLRGLSAEMDVFFVCHGTSSRQVRAIAEAVEEKMAELGDRPLLVEGVGEANWVLIDCADIVFHIFLERTREYYRLENLWSHAPYMKAAASGTGT